MSLFYRKLPCSVHRRERFWLQGLQLSPRHHWLHVSGTVKRRHLSCFLVFTSSVLTWANWYLIFPFRVEILQRVMELGANPSMGRSLLMRTSSWSTQDLVFCPWLTLGPTPTDPSSSSARFKLPGELHSDPSAAVFMPKLFQLVSHVRLSSL